MSLLLRVGGTTPNVYTYAASGGITFSGDAVTLYAPAPVIYTYVGGGVVTFDGAAVTFDTDTYEGTGLLAFGGAAVTALELPARGGVPGPSKQREERWHYLPGPPVHYDYEGAGEIIFGGAADTYFTRARRRYQVRPKPVEEPVTVKFSDWPGTSDAVIKRWQEENNEDEALLLMMISED